MMWHEMDTKYSDLLNQLKRESSWYSENYDKKGKGGNELNY